MNSENGKQERVATIGGTFDILHKGHKEYIRLAFQFADHVLIYVSSDKHVNGKKDYHVRPYELRIARLKDFLQENGFENRCEIHPLNELKELELDYLKNDNVMHKIYMAIISPEYYDFFLNLNHTREKRGMKSFLILVKLRQQYRNLHEDFTSSDMRQFGIHCHF